MNYYLGRVEHAVGTLRGRTVTTLGRRHGSGTAKPLGIYLSDHYTGAVAGVELAGRIAKNHRDEPEGRVFHDLAREVACDRDALHEIMAQLDVHPAGYRRAGAWLAEKAARLKPNGHLLRRSPLSSVVELEAMLLAIEGKAAGWRLLRTLADHDRRLTPGKLDDLERRARRQAETVEGLRRAAGVSVFETPRVHVAH